MLRANRKFFFLLTLISGALIFMGANALSKYNTIAQRLSTDGLQLVRNISQRVDQHDAHLTSLSALASGADKPLIDSMLQVAETVQLFYPHIVEINLIALNNEDPFWVSSNQADPGNRQILRRTIREAALASTGQLEMRLDPELDGRYLLIKRSPNSSNARYALSLTIDVPKLLERSITADVADQITLTFPSGEALYNLSPRTSATSGPSIIPQLLFKDHLSSTSQPLVIQAARHTDASALISIPQTLLFSAIWFAVVATLFALFDQRRKALDAQKKAHLGEHEAVIAHASRINALGEMASGIAHELNQPLTAILSQSQAALRMLGSDQSKSQLLEQALASNVQQSKRAGEILQRLRKWIKNDQVNVANVELNGVILSVVSLMQSQLNDKSIQLDVDLPKQSLVIYTDPVQFEQVIFNLLLNAIESITESDRYQKQVKVRVYSQANLGYVEIIDSGAGLQSDIELRIFEPFFTTKENGIGFGLPLCESILQRIGGSLEIINHPDGGAMATVTVPLVLGATR